MRHSELTVTGPIRAENPPPDDPKPNPSLGDEAKDLPTDDEPKS